MTKMFQLWHRKPLWGKWCLLCSRMEGSLQSFHRYQFKIFRIRDAVWGKIPGPRSGSVSRIITGNRTTLSLATVMVARLHRTERKTGILAVSPTTSPEDRAWDEKKDKVRCDEDEWRHHCIWGYHAERLRSCQKVCIFIFECGSLSWNYKNGFCCGPAGARKYGRAWQDNQCEQRDRHRHMPLGITRKSVPCFSA